MILHERGGDQLVKLGTKTAVTIDTTRVTDVKVATHEPVFAYC